MKTKALSLVCWSSPNWGNNSPQTPNNNFSSPWGRVDIDISPMTPPATPTMFSDASTSKSSPGVQFSDIMADEMKQRENWTRMRAKPLSLTQVIIMKFYAIFFPFRNTKNRHNQPSLILFRLKTKLLMILSISIMQMKHVKSISLFGVFLILKLPVQFGLHPSIRMFLFDILLITDVLLLCASAKLCMETLRSIFVSQYILDCPLT